MATAKKSADLATTLLDAPPARSWADEILETVALVKDAAYRTKRLAERVPTNGDADELLANALKVLDALGVRDSLIDAVGDARQTGAGCGSMLSNQMAPAFGELARVLVGAINAALDAGANAADPIIRPSDFAHLYVSSQGILFAPVAGAKPGHPVHSLTTLWHPPEGASALLGLKGPRYYRLSAVRSLTENVERRRVEELDVETRAKAQRDAVARAADEQTNSAFLRERIRQLESKLNH